MTDPALPVLPALRWTAGAGYGLDSPAVRAALHAGVRGFILFGGTADAAQSASQRLTRDAGRPLLLGADLERGAGQQFRGATPLPPLAALGALDDLEATRAAAALTARESVAMGVPWIFAPVADLAVEPENPIVGTRAFGRDPERVAEHVVAWVEGCLSQGGIPCVKHFPGHGRTLTDSHAALPSVPASRRRLLETDLVPFRRAVDAGVPTVMTAHVAYTGLDPSGLPATRSRPVITGLLREELGFAGVVVTDALIMEGAGNPESAVADALAAGVDILLYPPEGLDVAAALARGLSEGRLTPGALATSRRRVDRLLAASPTPTPPPRDPPAWGRPADRHRALSWAMRAVRDPRPASAAVPSSPAGPVALSVVDDDLGGPHPPPARNVFPEALTRFGIQRVDRASSRSGTAVLCIYAEPRAWKGRAGLSHDSRDRVGRWVRETDGLPRAAVIFGGPELVETLPRDVPVMLAWGGEPLMQEAAARRLAGAGLPPSPGGGR